MMASNEESSITHCYCESTAVDSQTFTCHGCKKLFHTSCLQSGKPSNLAGDIYFKFTCKNCSSDSVESFERLKLTWTTVLILALYNLQLQGGGKCGFFRWREHICKFIDKHWGEFFGIDKKKSATWHGTVAGCLSNGANRYFQSGAEVLKENGWWALRSTQLPTVEEIEASVVPSKVIRKRKNEESLIIEGSRKKHSNVFEAALSLKEKKIYVDEEVRVKGKKKSEGKASVTPSCQKLKLIVPKVEKQDGNTQSIPKIIIKTERNTSPKTEEDSRSQSVQESENINLGVSSDLPNMFDFSGSLDMSDSFNLLDDVFSEISCDKTSIKSSPKYDSDDDSKSVSKSAVNARKVQQHATTSRKKKAVTKEENPVKEIVTSDPKYTMMTPSEEAELLLKLENHLGLMKERPELRRLYRKLVVRKLKRERNIPVFDIDAEVCSVRGMDPPDYLLKDNSLTANPNRNGNVLDRYQLVACNYRNKSCHYSSFITRLMGLQEEQYETIISPYTERILKPFIFRDYKTKPLKLKLLEDIVAHANRSDPDFVPPKASSIDYCYVKPQHIPAINSLCNEFFWPGIDLSESLQYPDFSCVALYRKIVVGFAFMVPDVKYNEAYITFIFCHPEWRRAGIATFMLYHLIQTCMGKDVTLHVSAASSAVFLYQKFGFKVEEFIHGFYDKYLPPESKDCRHALFLRLSR